MLKYVIAALLILLFGNLVLAAYTYKWIDEKGTLNFSENPPQNGKYEFERKGRIAVGGEYKGGSVVLDEKFEIKTGNFLDIRIVLKEDLDDRLRFDINYNCACEKGFLGYIAMEAMPGETVTGRWMRNAHLLYATETLIQSGRHKDYMLVGMRSSERARYVKTGKLRIYSYRYNKDVTFFQKVINYEKSWTSLPAGARRRE